MLQDTAPHPLKKSTTLCFFLYPRLRPRVEIETEFLNFEWRKQKVGRRTCITASSLTVISYASDMILGLRKSINPSSVPTLLYPYVTLRPRELNAVRCACDSDRGAYILPTERARSLLPCMHRSVLERVTKRLPRHQERLNAMLVDASGAAGTRRRA